MNNRNSTSKKKLLSACTDCSAGSAESAVSNVSADSNEGEYAFNEIVEDCESVQEHEHSLENSNKMDINNKTRKKREELSISATKSIKKEKVEIVVNFD